MPVPEVAAYNGPSVGELAAVAGDTRLRSQTTLAVYTHATGQARKMALAAVGAYLHDSSLRLRVCVRARLLTVFLQYAHVSRLTITSAPLRSAATTRTTTRHSR